MAHNCCTLGFCLNWVVCGPAHNRDHWQLILLSPREQNSHCCGSLLETAGLPFLLGWQGGQLWFPSHTNHQWSLFWLITSATSRHFFNCFFFFFFPVCWGRFFPAKWLGSRSSIYTGKIRAFSHSGKMTPWDFCFVTVLNGKKLCILFSYLKLYS